MFPKHFHFVIWILVSLQMKGKFLRLTLPYIRGAKLINKINKTYYAEIVRILVGITNFYTCCNYSMGIIFDIRNMDLVMQSQIPLFN